MDALVDSRRLANVAIVNTITDVNIGLDLSQAYNIIDRDVISKCNTSEGQDGRVCRVQQRARHVIDGDAKRRRLVVVSPKKVPNISKRSVATFIFSERELTFTFAICCLSVCLSSVVCLSVTFVRATQAVHILGNISTALGTLAIHGHPLKVLRRSSQGNPSAGGVKDKRGSQI